MLAQGQYPDKRTFLRMAFVLLLTGWQLLGQSAAGSTPRPEDSIKDDSRLLTVETRARLRDAIGSAGRSGLRVGFAATTVLPSPVLASELRESWFPGDKNAVVIVYSRDWNRFLVSDAREKLPLYRGFEANKAIERANNSLAKLNRDRDGRDPIVVAEASNMIQTFGRLAREAGETHELADTIPIIGIWVAAAAILCLPIFLILRGGRRSGIKPHPLVFPEVGVPPRLGAINGGITGAEIGSLKK
ncbi:MAG: hypothetical protein ACKO2G_16320 [Verrucomicrobiales bacterium]